MAVITGTEGDDLLIGTLRRDIISGLGGADQLLGLDGDDDLAAARATTSCRGLGQRPAVRLFRQQQLGRR